MAARWGTLTIRTVVGGLLVLHGVQKLTTRIDGGDGLDGTAEYMDSLGLHPGRLNALAAAAAEIGGGAGLLLGAATPLAAAAIAGTMLTASRTEHGGKGPWAKNGGWEYNAVLALAALAVVDGGPGDVSVDARAGVERSGPLWMVGAALLALAGNVAVMAMGRSGSRNPKQVGQAALADVTQIAEHARVR